MNRDLDEPRVPQTDSLTAPGPPPRGRCSRPARRSERDAVDEEHQTEDHPQKESRGLCAARCIRETDQDDDSPEQEPPRRSFSALIGFLARTRLGGVRLSSLVLLPRAALRVCRAVRRRLERRIWASPPCRSRRSWGTVRGRGEGLRRLRHRRLGARRAVCPPTSRDGCPPWEPPYWMSPYGEPGRGAAPGDGVGDAGAPTAGVESCMGTPVDAGLSLACAAGDMSARTRCSPRPVPSSPRSSA